MSNIHEEMTIPASPSWVYETLVDPKRFAALCRAKTTGDAVEGAPFSQFDGHVMGRYIELVPDKRIVQAWRVKTWSDGVYSIVRFQFEEGTTPTLYGEGTHLVFDQLGVPAAFTDELLHVWKTYYWNALFSAFC